MQTSVFLLFAYQVEMVVVEAEVSVQALQHQNNC